MRMIATKKKPVFVQANSNSGQGDVLHFYTISRAFVSCLGCQHFISDWLGKLKPNKLSTGCQNELKGVAVEKATNPGRRFLFIFLAASRLVLARFAREFRGYAAPVPGFLSVVCRMLYFYS